MNIEALIRDCDGKYDSVALFSKVATAFPTQISWPEGFDYDAQERLRAALKSGKYVRAIFYKNHSKKMEITLNTKEAEMHKAINAKFKKGDKVVSADGKRGYISEVYGEGWYAVHFDGDRIDLDNKIQEYQLRAANCATVANAKFKVGQLVKHKNGDTGVIEVVNPANGFGDYMVRIVAGHGGFSGKASWDEKDLSVANCSTANSVVAKAVANARAANSSAEPTVAKNKEYDPEFPRKMREYTDSFKKRGKDALRKIDQAKALFSNAVSGYLSECIKWEKGFVNLYEECGFNYDAAIRSGTYVGETALRDALIQAEKDMRQCVAQLSMLRGAV